MTERDRNMLRAVELYYRDGLTQAAIAERLGCTRWTVGRLLKDASDSGVVTVIVSHPHARRHDLEVNLVTRFNLRAARVSPTQETVSDTLTLLAKLAADFLADLRPVPGVIAVSPGRTVAATAHAAQDSWAHGVNIAQANAAPLFHDGTLVGQALAVLAKRGRGAVRMLPGPLVAKSTREAQAQFGDNRVKTALAAARTADTAVFSPGASDAQSWTLTVGPDSEEHLENLTPRPVGSIMGHWIDENGNAVNDDLDRRTIALPLKDLRGIRSKVLIGHGVMRAPVIKAACAGGLADFLVIDSDTAEVLLAS